MGLLCGVHGHQFPTGWQDRLQRLRLPIITTLTMDASYYVPLLYRPGMIVVLRKYDSDCMGHDPLVWADSVDHDVKEIAARYGIPLKDVIAQGYNELELDVEHNNSGYNGQSWDSDAAWPVRRDWIMAFHRRMNDRNPEYMAGVLWSSPGHSDVDGRQEIQQFIDLGLFNLKNITFGGHYYARGLTEAGNPQGNGGYDAPDKEWYSDRCLKVRDILDANGLQHIKIWIGETNRKDIEQGDILGELDRWSGRIAHAVAGWTFFIWDSPDPSFATFRLGSVLTDDTRLARFQGIIDKYAGVQPGPTPEPEPEPPPVNNDPLIAKYNLIVTETAEIGVSFTDDTSGQVELVAVMAPNTSGSLRTADGQHGVDGAGTLSVIMAGTSAYFPEAGQHGPWEAACAGAKVEGLGMKPDHTHPRTTFYRKAPKPPDPPQPPTTGHTWFGAFGGYAAATGLGPPTGDIIYLPDHFRSAVQENDAVILVWDGNGVHEVRKS